MKFCREIKPHPRHTGGGLYIHLWRDGKRKTHSVARLVAEAFIPNPENKPIVKHTNGNNKDNRVENLRWANGEERFERMYHNGV